MNVFGLYSRYYDLLYRDKDYVAEARFISDELRGAAPDARTVLELGCGTGKHALALAGLGWEVAGVDLSAGMVAAAQERRQAAAPALAARVEFREGDARSVRFDGQFDTVVSLFHVMSYQTTDADLAAVFRTAAIHLKPGGLLFFDFWNGPGVLADPPAVRIKRLENESLQMTRIAEPEMKPERNGVLVKYQIFLKDRGTGRIEEIQEQHPMRYLFIEEIAELARAQGMSVLHSSAWMDRGRPAGPEAWYGCVLARRDAS